MPSLARAYGGPVEALIGYVAAARSVGLTTVVVGPRSTPNDLEWLRASIPHAAVEVAAPWSSGPWRGAPAVLARVRARVSDADVVHVHGLLNPISSFAAGAALRVGRPLVIGPFGTLSRYTFTHRRSTAKRWYLRFIDAPNLRRAAAIHFTTGAEEDGARWTGIDVTGRSHIVPPPFYAVPAAPTAVHAGSTVLFLGRLHPVKGVDLLIDAWPTVRATRPEANLVIAGRGSPAYERELRARVTRLGPDAASVSFVGFVQGSDKAAHLGAASACVLPSRHENFGIAVLEAIAAGVPVVVAPGVQLGPWVAAEGLGLIAERTAPNIAAGIVRLLEDSTLRSRVGREGAARVTGEFGPAAIAPKLQAMYDAAASRMSPASRAAVSVSP